jgi:hypothetical protein
MSMPTQGSIIVPWRTHAEALADWTIKHLLNRLDVWGGYLPERYRHKVDPKTGKPKHEKTVTKPPRAKRGKVQLERATISRHNVGHIIGLHTTSTANTCRWFAIEIDAHEPTDTDAPGRNFRAAIHRKTKLEAAGFTTIMLDSNGAGEIHLLVILDAPAPAADVYAFVQSTSFALPRKCAAWRRRRVGFRAGCWRIVVVGGVRFGSSEYLRPGVGGNGLRGLGEGGPLASAGRRGARAGTVSSEVPGLPAWAEGANGLSTLVRVPSCLFVDGSF